RAASTHDVPTSLVGFEPCMHIEFENAGGVQRRELLWLMNQELVRHGIFTLGAFILCFSHNSRDLRRLAEAVDASMTIVRQAIDRGTTEGLLDQRVRECFTEITGPATWRRANSG